MIVVNHDRVHAREPDHHVDRWDEGVLESVDERDGHCVLTVRSDDGATVELTVSFAVRDLFLGRLDVGDGSPVGERVWYRVRGE